jgi:ferrochelatase
MKYLKEPKHNHDNPAPKVGVLLINLGTPSATDYFSMRRYLKQFLSDPRVVEMNRALWWFVLNVILLSFIPFRSRKNYRKIWNTEKNESPLLTTTRAQAEKLNEKYVAQNIVVDFAMRYGTPTIADKIQHLKAQKCKKILIFPLYPQYSAVTTASVCDDVFNALKRIRWIPIIKVASPYYKHSQYIKALKESVEKHMKDVGQTFKDTKLICSYHGIPKRYFMNGDPYPCHCTKTTMDLQKALGLSKGQIEHVYQSRFGKEEWMQPYLDKRLEELPSENQKNIVVISPAFASDCVETLEELQMEGKDIFREYKGEHYSVVPCLNDSDSGINMLKTVVDEELVGFTV